MNYSTQLTEVKKLIINNNKGRFDCFNCGRHNTLSVNMSNGEISWFCFYAQCGVRGKATFDRDTNTLRNALSPATSYTSVFVPPEHFTNAWGNELARKYLEKHHCVDAYLGRLADIRYDPRQDRVVFLVSHDGTVVDAAGRSLKKGVVPKWLRYASSDYPFVAGTSDVAVIVEDCCSACAVSPVATGVALLGTNLKTAFVSTLKRFSRVIIALDPDATAKAIALHRELSYFVQCSVVRLNADLKYHSPNEAKAILGL